MSDFPQLSGGGLALDDFRFVVYGYLWKTRCSVDCFVLELLQLFSLRKLSDGDARLLKHFVELVLLIFDWKPRLHFPLPMHRACIEQLYQLLFGELVRITVSEWNVFCLPAARAAIVGPAKR